MSQPRKHDRPISVCDMCGHHYVGANPIGCEQNSCEGVVFWL